MDASTLSNKFSHDNLNRRASKHWKHLLIFYLFAILICIVSYAFFQHYKESIKIEKQDELSGIADLKIQQITNWITIQKSNAQIIMEDSTLISSIDQWLQQGSPRGITRTNLVNRLTSLQHVYADLGYKSVSLFDDKAILRLSSSTGELPIKGIEKTSLLESMRTGQLAFSELHQDQEDLSLTNGTEIELRAPLTMFKNGRMHIVGAILFRIDPYRFLFPLVQYWPTPSQSAENILIRREGNNIVFLSALRFSQNLTHSMEMPPIANELQGMIRIPGNNRNIEILNYRGVPIVGVMSMVPGTSWELLSQIDQDEIYSPINRLAILVTILILVLAGVGGGVTVLWQEKQHAREIERQVLFRHLHYLTKFANDVIMLVDSTGKIIDFNERALDVYGYSAEKFTTLNIVDLQGPESITPFIKDLMVAHKLQSINTEQEFQKDTSSTTLLKNNMLRYETLHKGKNNTVVPVEVQLQIVHENIGESIFVVIVRDISDRKKSERELFEQKALLRQVIDSDPNTIFVRDAQGKFLLINQSAAALYGLHPNQIVGKDLVELGLAHANYTTLMTEDLNIIKEGSEVSFIEPYELPSGERRWNHTFKKRLAMSDGYFSVLNISMDITQQKISEIKLDKSYKKLQRLSLHLESVRADERARIAHHLHDEMGATLVAIKMSIAWLVSKLPADPPQLLEEAAHITELVTSGIHTMRQAVTQLMPNLIGQIGLDAAIRDYVKKFCQHSNNIECKLILPENELVLNSDQSLTIFRIFQESLNNVMKHAQATKLKIVIAEKNDALSMQIVDNGIGFNPTFLKNQSYGLLGIKERALMIGGKAKIKSFPGKGTRVSITIPLSSQQNNLVNTV